MDKWESCLRKEQLVNEALEDLYHCYEYSPFRDISGNPVKRTKYTHPYSYDSFVVYQDENNKGNNSVYSDRLYQWDYKKYNKYCKEVWGNEGQYFDDRNPEDIQKFLGLYLDKEIQLTLIMECCNQSNGYPYWYFEYKEV